MTTKFDPTKPVQTRDGRPARILATDVKPSGIFALVTEFNSTEYVKIAERPLFVHAVTGCVFDPDCPHPDDLINVPETHELWLNVCEAGAPLSRTFSFHKTREMADNPHTTGGRIARLKLTFTEGQFDE